MQRTKFRSRCEIPTWSSENCMASRKMSLEKEEEMGESCIIGFIIYGRVTNRNWDKVKCASTVKQGLRFRQGYLQLQAKLWYLSSWSIISLAWGRRRRHGNWTHCFIKEPTGKMWIIMLPMSAWSLMQENIYVSAKCCHCFYI